MKQALKSGGAAREFYISDLVTHVIATDTNFPQFSEAKDCNLTVVQVHIHFVYLCLGVRTFTQSLLTWVTCKAILNLIQYSNFLYI